jgi:hypothetical protein
MNTRQVVDDITARRERIEQEAIGLARDIANGVKMRSDHPSYGYGKTTLRANLHRLEGILWAWMLLTGVWDFAGRPMLAKREKEIIIARLNIDLDKLSTSIDAS